MPEYAHWSSTRKNIKWEKQATEVVKFLAYIQHIGRDPDSCRF